MLCFRKIKNEHLDSFRLLLDSSPRKGLSGFTRLLDFDQFPFLLRPPRWLLLWLRALLPSVLSAHEPEIPLRCFGA